MDQFVHLIGAEQVTNAASRMRDAANEMMHAANSISETYMLQQRWMEEWIQRFEVALANKKEK